MKLVVRKSKHKELYQNSCEKMALFILPKSNVTSLFSNTNRVVHVPTNVQTRVVYITYDNVRRRHGNFADPSTQGAKKNSEENGRKK